MQGLDALGISAGLATPLATTHLAVFSAGLAARGELRFGDTFDMRPVHSAGLAADATLDMILRDMPIVVGARVSQGITPLVAERARDRGAARARPRAALAEHEAVVPAHDDVLARHARPRRTSRA